MPSSGLVLGPQNKKQPFTPHTTSALQSLQDHKASPGMEKARSLRLSLPQEGEYSFMPKFCPQFSSHSSTWEHLFSVFLLWRMIYMLFLSTSVLFSSLVFIPSQEEWSEFVYRKMLYDCIRGKKKKKRGNFFHLNSLDPCRSPEEKVMISSSITAATEKTDHLFGLLWPSSAMEGVQNPLHP